MRALLVVAVLAAACAPPPPVVDAGPPPVDGPLAASSYCETIEPFFCPFYLRCGRIAAADLAACTETFMASCEARYEPTYVDLERAGLLSLSRAGVDACRAHLEDVACSEQLLDLDGACGAMWVGTQEVSAPCGFDVESFVCAPDAVCVLGLDFCGTCEQALDVGAPCGGEVDGSCVRTATCVDGACVQRALPGASCDDATPCVLGARCDTGVCVGPDHVGVGDACDQQRRCPYASRCADGVCAASAANGDACEPAAGCTAGFCDDEGVCAVLAEPGDACAVGGACRTGICVDGACGGVPTSCITP